MLPQLRAPCRLLSCGISGFSEAKQRARRFSRHSVSFAVSVHCYLGQMGKPRIYRPIEEHTIIRSSSGGTSVVRGPNRYSRFLSSLSFPPRSVWRLLFSKKKPRRILGSSSAADITQTALGAPDKADACCWLTFPVYASVVGDFIHRGAPLDLLGPKKSMFGPLILLSLGVYFTGDAIGCAMLYGCFYFKFWKGAAD